MEFNFEQEPGKKQINPFCQTPCEALVSIITPFYNAGQYFEQTFYSVINQTFPWFEWIIVNDGSTQTADIELLEKIAGLDVRIHIFHKENGGPSTARNMAIRNAAADIIIPLDADDLIEPNYIELLYWALYFNPEYDWAYTNSVGFQDQQYTWDKPFNASILKSYNYLTYSGAIRKTALNEVGGYDESRKRQYEDWHLWLKLLAAHKKPIKIPNLSFWYRRSDTGVLSSVNRDTERKKQAEQLIHEIADSVDVSITAKVYPSVCAKNQWRAPSAFGIPLELKIYSGKTDILFIFPWLEMGGADKFNLDLIKGLDSAKYSIHIVTTKAAPNTWKQLFEEYVSELFELPNFLDLAHYSDFLAYLIKSRNIKLVFLSNSYYGYYAVPWLKHSFPSVAFVDYVHMEEWYWRNGGYARTSGSLGPLLDCTYVCNGATKNVLIEIFHRDARRIKTAYIGVDDEFFCPDSTSPGIIYRQLSIDKERPIILFPCRIHPQKRPFLMLQIALELKKRGRNYAFVVVGDGPQMEELKNAISKEHLQDSVFCVGRQTDMRPYYCDAAITLICSLKEGLALTAYESLAMGTPVVSSDVGGQAELISEDVGLVVPLLQNEANDLDTRIYSQEEILLYADAIESLLSSPEEYQKICSNCRLRIQNGFSQKLMLRHFDQEFERLLDTETTESRIKETTAGIKYLPLWEDYLTLYREYEWLENYASNINQSYDTKNELLRIANSVWGQRLIKIAFKLKLNKLIK